MYQLESLRQTYGNRAVLDIPTMQVRESEILALVGPSGAGKSTLLRLLNFLETPTSGMIRFAGQTINGAAPLAVRRQVTTVFQRPVLRRASVRANIAYGLGLRGLPADGRVDAMLEEVGLTGLAKQGAHTLSGGEMQRVALARALVIEPRVLLLDEPTANLDPYNVGLIEEIIRRQNQERGTTIVIVTHNVFQAKRLAHRVGLLLAGNLIELADTATFFNTPADARTAAFVRGEMVY
ncbi:MAG: phosphate ABC transporter ATP-binding protein [Chloroflexi bacterium]|nr:phosphate ABC transporter ATP-binding protein [Chloroflexota bacterium]